MLIISTRLLLHISIWTMLWGKEMFILCFLKIGIFRASSGRRELQGNEGVSILIEEEEEVLPCIEMYPEFFTLSAITGYGSDWDCIDCELNWSRRDDISGFNRYHERYSENYERRITDVNKPGRHKTTTKLDWKWREI